METARPDDQIMCIEVLEHAPASTDALREMSRLPKPGGILLVTAPFCSLTHFAPYFYHTDYGRMGQISPCGTVQNMVIVKLQGRRQEAVEGRNPW